MTPARFGWLVLALGLWTSAAWSADPKPAPAPAPKAAPKAPDAKTEPAKPRTLENMKLPGGAILVIVKDNVRELFPNLVLLTPEKYQELLDQVDALKKQIKPPRPEAPSSCKLTNGQVEGDVVRLQAQFDFRTEKPRTLVTFGCQRAWLRSASLDGHLPLFAPAGADDSLTIQVEAAGVHQLNVDLALPLTRGTKGNDRGFDLGLPHAAITNLEQFTIPVAVPDVRVNGRSVKTRPVDGQHCRLEGLTLGPVDRLEVTWKGPAPAAAKGKPILAADGKINIRVEEKTVTTDVELTLQTLRGEAKQWRIFLPPGAMPQLQEPLPQDERIEVREMPTAKEPWLTIKLKEPSAEALRVAFTLSQARTGNKVAIGPFSVLDTLRHRGTVTVRAPSDLRLNVVPRPNLKEREVTEEMRRDKVISYLSYWNVAAPANPMNPGPPLVELEVEAVKGAVEVRVDHTLQQSDNSVQVITRIDADPSRTGVEQIELAVSPEYPKRFDRDRGASPASLIEEVVFDEKRNVAIVKLAEKQFARFSVSLPALFPLTKDQKSVSIELPRPVGMLDRGGQATVTLAEGRALVTRQNSPDAPPPGSRKHTWRWDRAPGRFDFEWHDYQPEFPIESLADVTLAEGQARVRQQIDLQFPGASPAFVPLTIPPALRGRVQLLQGGSLGGDGLVRLDRPARKVSLLLSYVAPAEPVGRPARREGEEVPEELLAVPLVQPPAGTRVETKVRVWVEPGVRVVPADASAWVRLPAEILPEKDCLPSLVLRTVNPRPALALKQQRSAESPLASVVIDRALIQVTLADEGYQTYRARFLLARLGSRHLDLEMPAPLSGLNLEVTLDGKKVPIQTLDASGKVVDNGTVLRLNIEPDLYTRPVILDIHYQLAPGRSRSKGMFHSTLTPPEPRGDVFLGRVRWQVVMPQGWLALHLGGGYQAEQRWEWHGGLLSARPALNAADLERWLGTSVSLDDASADDSAPGLVCGRADLSSFSILQVPQQGWLLISSLLFLSVGLCLAFTNIPRSLFWFAIALLGGGAAYLSITWPSLVPALIYGCEPGAAVLLIILVVQWMLHRHYHRQLVFLPGFTRVKAGASSLLREGPATRTRGEPSTVDVPRIKKESSFQ